jgi:ABC-2 type transport system permease protein
VTAIPTDLATRRPPGVGRLPTALRRTVRLLVGFGRQGLHQRLAYRAFFWTHLLNTVVKVVALAVVWSTLYDSQASSFPIDKAAMISYAVIAAVSSEFLTWWDGPHTYIAERLRMGTLTSDLLRPVYFPFEVFALWLGQSLAVLCTVTAPVLVVAIALFHVAAPVNAQAALLFFVSFGLSYLLLFTLNFLLGLVVVLTLSVRGLLVTYHAVITLLSGFWVPLWFYPHWLRTAADWLPFKDLFFTPLSIYVGLTSGHAAVSALLGQLVWLTALGALALTGWRRAQRRLVIQGG